MSIGTRRICELVGFSLGQFVRGRTPILGGGNVTLMLTLASGLLSDLEDGDFKSRLSPAFKLR